MLILLIALHMKVIKLMNSQKIGGNSTKEYEDCRICPIFKVLNKHHTNIKIIAHSTKTTYLHLFLSIIPIT